MKRENRISARHLPSALGMAFLAGLFHSGAGTAEENGTDAGNALGAPEVSRPGSGSIFSRTSALWSNSQWQAFKRIWRKLDSISPANGDYSTLGTDTDKMNLLRVELNKAVSELRGIASEAGIDSVELALLERLAYDRMDFLTYGEMLLLTRMMPPPVSDQTDDMLPRIEAGIDVLTHLRESGMISRDEMATAFENLSSMIDTYCVLEVINGSMMYSVPSVWTMRWPTELDEIRAAMDSVRTVTLEELDRCGEAYEGQLLETIEILDNLDIRFQETVSRLPALHDLLMDLELY